MKKRILACCFFPAFDPPMSGGEQKLLRFYEALSEDFEIDLVTWTYPTRSETLLHRPDFREHRIASDDQWQELSAQLAQWGYKGEFSGLLSALHGRLRHSPYRDKLTSLWDQADIVIHDFPYTLGLEPFGQDPSKLYLYNSHNFEATLTRSVFQGPDDDFYDLIEGLEESLAARSDLVFATSELEAQAMGLRYGLSPSRLHILPLGFDPREVAEPQSIDPAFVLFIGSQHGPNIAAAKEIVEIARALPEVNFTIAGRVCERLSDVPQNLRLLGEISAKDRIALFAEASLFLNPMRAGAGMNVKMTEALGAGLPILSTPLGARGFAVEALSITLADDRDEMIALIRAKLARPWQERQNERLAIMAKAEELYSWPKLALKAREAIDHALSRPAAAPLPQIQLYVNDFPLGEGRAGGQKRMLSLIGATAASDLKVLLTLGNRPEIALCARSSDFIEINIPKTAKHLAFDRLCAKHSAISLDDFSSAMHVLDNPLYLRWFEALSKRAASLTYEHCYMVPLLEHLPQANRPRLIYSAHNVEADLKAEMLAACCHSHGPQLADMARDLEAELHHNADAVIAVSEQDSERFVALYGPRADVTIIPNGTEIAPPPQMPRTDGPLRLIFIGSAHPPNVTGLRAFIQEVLPLLGELQLDVIGGVCMAFAKEVLDPRVKLLGMVSEEAKAIALAQADVAINPVLQGGGSSLKIGDYLAAGLALVSTPVGLRGFDLQAEEAVLLADLGEDFAKAITRLEQDLSLRSRLGQKGRDYAVTHLDWQHLGEIAKTTLAPLDETPWLAPRSALMVIDEPRLAPDLSEETLLAKIAELSSDYQIDLLVTGKIAPSLALRCAKNLRLLRHIPLDLGGAQWLSAQAQYYDAVFIGHKKDAAATLLEAAATAFSVM